MYYSQQILLFQLNSNIAADVWSRGVEEQRYSASWLSSQSSDSLQTEPKEPQQARLALRRGKPCDDLHCPLAAGVCNRYRSMHVQRK